MTARPTARGPDPFRSVLFVSHVANTVKTSTNVIITSTTSPAPGVTSGWSMLTPSVPRYFSGVTIFATPAAAKAPTHCANTYTRARARLIRRARNIGRVTAGLMWAPLTSARHQRIDATARPEVSDKWTMDGGGSPQFVPEPVQKKTSKKVPNASAVTARQKSGLCRSSIHVAIAQTRRHIGQVYARDPCEQIGFISPWCRVQYQCVTRSRLNTSDKINEQHGSLQMTPAEVNIAVVA